MFGQTTEFRIFTCLSVLINLLHGFLQVFRRNTDLCSEVVNCIGLECPASLLTDFECLRKGFQRNTGHNDSVERKQSTLVDQLVIFLLVDNVVHHAAGACHGVVNVNEHRAAGFVEEAFAVLVDPKPGLSQSAAALFEFVSAHELVDRGQVGKVRSVTGNGVHAFDAGTD